MDILPTKSSQPTFVSIQTAEQPTVTSIPQATASPQPTSVSNLVELPTVTSSLLDTEGSQPGSQTHTVVPPTVTSSPQATESQQLLDLISSEAFKQTSDLSRTVQVTQTLSIHSSTIESVLPSSLGTQLRTGLTQPPNLVTMETTIVPSTTLPLSTTTSTMLSSTAPLILPYTVSVQVFSSPSLSPTPPPPTILTSYGGDVSCTHVYGTANPYDDPTVLHITVNDD